MADESNCCKGLSTFHVLFEDPLVSICELSTFVVYLPSIFSAFEYFPEIKDDLLLSEYFLESNESFSVVCYWCVIISNEDVCAGTYGSLWQGRGPF